MRKRPKGAKYRNLTVRNGVIYYERLHNGHRTRVSAKTDDWDEAAAFRDEYEREFGLGPRVPFLAAPTFAEMAERYLEAAVEDLAGTTYDDRQRLLGPEGRLTRHFGEHRMDELGRAEILAWWEADVLKRGVSASTGRNYFNALSAVFGYAWDFEKIQDNPIPSVREVLKRRRRSKQGRAEGEGGRHVAPIEDLGELGRFVAASRAAYGMRFGNLHPVVQRRAGHVADLLQLDAGLRLGEVAGLRWCDVVWGENGNDPARALLIRRSRSRGRHLETPKSGRERRVALSKRLRALLQDFRIQTGRPDAEEPILERFAPDNYRRRHFDQVVTEAKLARALTPKDLRDTFASQLLSSGVQLAWVSQQLGHSDTSVTARHYARWTGELYRAPLKLRKGELPPDLLARVAADAGSRATQPSGTTGATT